MKHTAIFYEGVGHLFYAIANTNARMSLLEQKRMNDIIEGDWAEEISEELNSKQVLFFIIRQESRKNAVWKSNFSIFETYYKENEEEFTDELKEKIYRNAESIVAVSRNKGANVAMLTLSRLFWD